MQSQSRFLKGRRLEEFTARVWSFHGFLGLNATMDVHASIQGVPGMPETDVKNLEITPKPKCLRCGLEHTVSDVGHWAQGWWTCSICNIRWEEDEFD